MPGNQILPFLRLGALLVASLTLTGCLLDEGYETSTSRSSGVSLSQAMHSSASGSSEPLHGSGSTETHTFVDTDVGVSTSASSGSAAATTSHDDKSFTVQVPMDVAYAVPFNGEFRSITKFTLTPLCVENDHNSFGFFLGGDIMDLKPGGLPASAIDNTWMLEAGFSYRRYFNRAHAFISPYFSANIACQGLFWDYRNPVFIDGKEIQSDTLEGAGGYAGFGIAFNRNTHFSFFGEAGFGGTAFVDQTAQGFGNDVFHNFGYFTVKAGLCIKF
jgi:hypothetical protein